jgi:hypothetical protein
MRNFAPPWQCTPLRKFADRWPPDKFRPWADLQQQSPKCKFAPRVEPRALLAADHHRNHANWQDFWRRTRLTFGKFSEGDHRGSKSCFLAPWSRRLASPRALAPTIRKPANLFNSSAPGSTDKGTTFAKSQKVRPVLPPELHCPAACATGGSARRVYRSHVLRVRKFEDSDFHYTNSLIKSFGPFGWFFRPFSGGL